MMVSPELYLVGTTLFVIGLWGMVVMRSNVLIVLLSIELMILGVSLNFTTYSYYLDDITGQLISLVILVVAGSESVIGLAIFVAYHRMGSSVAISYLHSLRG